MKKIKAYTLMEMLVVMSIMIIVLSIGIASYVAYIETTKYNQDVANLQHDVLSMQKASMLFKKDSDDGWLYGVGIDFGNMAVGASDGTYRFFKWCSGFESFGSGGSKTSGKYPNYDSESGNDTSLGIHIPDDPDLFAPYSKSSCVVDPLNVGSVGGHIVSLPTYGTGNLNLGSDVEVSGGRFLLFESVTGRAFVFDDGGNIVLPDATQPNIEIVFKKRRGSTNKLIIENLTGRTKIVKVEGSIELRDPDDGSTIEPVIITE